MRFATAARVAAVGLFLLAIAVIGLYLFPSGSEYVFFADRAHPLAPLVRVPGGHPPTDGGGIYFVDVPFRKARLLEALFPSLAGSDSTVVSVGEVRGRGVSESQQRRLDLRDMAVSQQVAAAVALRRLGYPVRDRATGVLVDAFIGNVPAARTMQVGDRIIGLDGKPIRSIAALHRGLSRHRAGDLVRIRVDRAGRTLQLRVQSIADPRRPQQAFIGISSEPAVQITVPLRIRIDLRGVGGPSAGLAFALDLTEELGHDIDRGYRVAATGTLALDGSVGEIGAIKQKTIGARLAHVDVFLVPSANLKEARRFAHGLRVIPVDTFQQALRALATLPAKNAAKT